MRPGTRRKRQNDDGTYTMKKVRIQNTEQLELVSEEIRVFSLFNHPNLLPLLDHAIISVKVSYVLYTIHPLTRLLIALSKHKMVNNSSFIYFPIKSHSSFWPSFNSYLFGLFLSLSKSSMPAPLELKPIHLFFLFIYRFLILSPFL